MKFNLYKMKKLLFASAIVLGTVGFSACDSNKTETTTDNNEMVIDRDTTVSEVEVDRTVVEMDTTVETNTVDVEKK